MTRRDTQDEAWNAWDDETSDDLDGRILALLRANPQGLTDEAMGRALGALHQTVSGNRRHLVEKGRVRFSGERVVKANGRRSRTWVLGVDTPAERAGTRRWPPIYTEIRRLVEQPNIVLPSMATIGLDRPGLLALAAGLIRRADRLAG